MAVLVVHVLTIPKLDAVFSSAWLIVIPSEVVLPIAQHIVPDTIALVDPPPSVVSITADTISVQPILIDRIIFGGRRWKGQISTQCHTPISGP